MKRFELPPSPESRVALHETESGYEIKGRTYTLRLEQGSHYITLLDERGATWMQAFMGSSIATTESNDVTLGFEAPRHEVRDDGSVAIYIPSRTETDSLKEQIWICRNEFIETSLSAEISGSLRHVDLLGGIFVQPNIAGTSMSQRHFNSVYNPQPSEVERPVISAYESTRIATNGMWKPGRRREFLITPNIFGFSMAEPREDNEVPEGTWLMTSISAPIEEQNMSDYCYDAHEDGFMLHLKYDGTELKQPNYTSPSLLLHFAPNIEEGLQNAKRHWEELGHLQPVIPVASKPWHTGTKYVTWGSQLEQERTMHDIGVSLRARDTLTEGFVANALDSFEEHGIAIDTIILDDKWQKEYGTNIPDLEKFPNAPRFIDTQHAIGRHVLLWMKLFDPEGLPPEVCIIDTQGRPIASDPTNPDFQSLVHEQVYSMLAPSGMNADGLKLDFLAQLPNGPGLRWHGSARGPAALYEYMKVIYDAALSAKKDALIQAQIVHPWFADVFNQIRLNDINERHSVIRTMGSRAQLATTLLPHHTIDPDGWPLPSKQVWREYIGAQPLTPRSGVTTHFVDTVNGESLDEGDFKALREAIRRLRYTSKPR